MDKRINIETERAAFEAWHRSKFATKHSTGQPTRDMHNGIYDENYGPKDQQLMWEVWQAACATPSATGETEDLPPLPLRTALTITTPDAKGRVEVSWEARFYSSMKEPLFTADQIRQFGREAIAHYLRKQAGQVGVKTWQERMPEPRWEKFCDMNCSPRPRSLDDCPDCVSIKCYGDPVAARDAEIAELRAALAPWSRAEGGHGEPEATNFRQEGEQPTTNKGEG